MTFTPSIFYKDPMTMLAWLERAFGFETTMLIEGPDGDVRMMHSEMAFNGKGRIMVGAEWADWVKAPGSVGGANTQSVSVDVESDIDAHCERARAAGAIIVQEPNDQFYGERTYRAVDPEGHHWSFGQTIREMTNAEMEAASGLTIRTSLQA